MNVSKFQPGEERDLVVKEIGEPDVVAELENGDRCEVYIVDTTGQGTFRHRFIPAMEVNTSGGPTFVAIGTIPTSRWNGMNLNHHVVVCYKNEKVVRVMAKPCPSASCAKASPSPGPRPMSVFYRREKFWEQPLPLALEKRTAFLEEWVLKVCK